MPELQDTQNGLAWMIAVLLLKEGRAPKKVDPGWNIPDATLYHAGIASSPYYFASGYKLDCPGEYERNDTYPKIYPNERWILEWIDKNVMTWTIKYIETKTYISDSNGPYPWFLYTFNSDYPLTFDVYLSCELPTSIYEEIDKSGTYYTTLDRLIGSSGIYGGFSGFGITSFEDIYYGRVITVGNKTTVSRLTRLSYEARSVGAGRLEARTLFYPGGRAGGRSETSSITYPAGTEIKFTFSIQQVVE